MEAARPLEKANTVIQVWGDENCEQEVGSEDGKMWMNLRDI